MSVSGGVRHGAAVFISILYTLNLVLFAFNLLPLYPLDGSVAIGLLMSERFGERYRAVMLNPAFSMFGLFFAWQGFDPLFDPFFGVALQVLYPGYFGGSY